MGQQISSERCRAALRRVLESDALRHSDSLRRLLSYLGEKSLTASSNDLKEYTIGLEAFGKPENYDPQLDPTVRVLASKLRHRLDEYYHREGAEDAIRVDIPRGHYELRFKLRSEEDRPFDPSALRSEARKWRRRSIALGIAVLGMLFAAALVFWRTTPGRETLNRTRSVWTPELDLIWEPFLGSDHPVLVVLGTPLFTKIEGQFFRDPNVNLWEKAEQSRQTRFLKRELRSDYAVPAFPYTGVGEAAGAFTLCKLLQSRVPNLTVKRSNMLSWDEIRVNSIIFLGPPKFNQHLKDIPAGGGFAMEGGTIHNLKPQPGERANYTNRWSENHMELLEDYALIQLLPGLHGHGDIMILAAGSTEATWAAVEYVTRADYVRELVQRLRLPSGQMPRGYQAVIRVQLKSMVPFRISYEAHRVLEKPGSARPHPPDAAQPANP